MAKRIKPSVNIPCIMTLAEADSTLGRIAALKRNLKLIEASANDELDTIKLKAEQKAEPMRQQLADLETALVRYAEAHKDELFTDKQRSRALSFGTIGYRFSSFIDTIGKTSWKEVLAKLEEKCLDKFIRSVPEVDKEALRKADADVLKSVRCTMREKDEFYYEIENYDLGSGPDRAA